MLSCTMIDNTICVHILYSQWGFLTKIRRARTMLYDYYKLRLQ